MEGRARTAHGWVGCPCNYSTLSRGVDRHLAISAVIATDRSSSDLRDLRVGDHLLPFGDVRLDVGANAAGDIPFGSRPIASSLPFTSGRLVMRAIFGWRRSTIDGGVPAG